MLVILVLILIATVIVAITAGDNKTRTQAVVWAFLSATVIAISLMAQQGEK